MGFLDSSSGVIDCILTRKGRELLAKNDGSFKITKFAFGDDEINYQLYNSATDDDSAILNLPILEASSNEESGLRYRLVTLPKGAVSVATLTINPSSIRLGAGGETAAITIDTIGGRDNSYSVISRNSKIVTVTVGNVVVDADGTTSVIGFIQSYDLIGTTIIDIVGNDTGAATTLLVTVLTAR